MKKLYRSRSDRYIGGVCGGIGEYLNIDPVIIRILFILSGVGIFFYLLLVLLIPENPYY